MIVESLRCPYCLAAVEIRQGDNWTVYWCSQHGPIEHPISFSDSALADGCVSTSPDVTPGVCHPLAFPAVPPLPPGFFIESSRMHPTAMSLFQLTNLITARSGASREGLSDG